MVGGDYVERNLKCLALEGRLAQIAFLKKSRVELDLRQVMMKRLTVTGSTLRASPKARKVALARALRERVWPLFAEKRLKVVLNHEFALADAAQAHALMESGTLIGKIVLAVRPGAAAPDAAAPALRAPSSVGRAAARQVEHRARRERAFLARQPADQRGDLLDRAEAPHRDLGQHEVDVLLRHLVEDGRAHRGRRHAVGADAGAGEFLADGLGQADHRRLRRTVGRRIRIAFLAGHRGDVDDAPVVARAHHRNDGAVAAGRCRAR